MNSLRFFLLFIYLTSYNNLSAQINFEIVDDKNYDINLNPFCYGDSVTFTLIPSDGNVIIDSIIWFQIICTDPNCSVQIDNYQIIKTYKSNKVKIFFNNITPIPAVDDLFCEVFYKINDISKSSLNHMWIRNLWCNITPNYISNKRYICEGECISYTDLSDRQPTYRSWHFEGADTEFSMDSVTADICYSIPGLYDVTLFVGNPADTDTLILKDYIEVKPRPDIEFPEFQTIKALSGDTLLLESCVIGEHYRWIPGDGIECDTCRNTTLIVGGNIQYKSLVTSEDYCPYECIIEVRVSSEDLIYVPNVFSPNDDGINDDLKPSYNKDIRIRKFSIFNRWGGLMYSTIDGNDAWDGTYNGILLNPGVYVWVVEYFNSKTNSNNVLKGSTTLVR